MGTVQPGGLCDSKQPSSHRECMLCFLRPPPAPQQIPSRKGKPIYLKGQHQEVLCVTKEKKKKKILKPSRTTGESFKWYNHYGRQYKTLKIESPYNLTIAHLGRDPKLFQAAFQRYLHIRGHGSTIHDSQEGEETQASVNR